MNHAGAKTPPASLYWRVAGDELKLEATHLRELLGDRKEFVLGMQARDLHDEKTSGDMIKLTATVAIVESKGSESIVHLDYMGEHMTQYVHGVATHDMGDTLPLWISPEDVYVFDGETEAMLTRYSSP